MVVVIDRFPHTFPQRKQIFIDTSLVLIGTLAYMYLFSSFLSKQIRLFFAGARFPEKNEVHFLKIFSIKLVKLILLTFVYFRSVCKHVRTAPALAVCT